MDRSGGDWRAQLQPETRSRIVNKIRETLMKHIPVSVPDGLNDLEQIAARFEDKIYAVATNQSDYLRKISLKMLSVETSAQQAAGNAQAIPNQNNSAPGPPPQGSNQAQTSAISLMSQQQARQPNTSTSVQASSLTNIGQNMPGVNQTSTMHNVSVMPHDTINNGLVQGTSQDIFAAQMQMAGRQQHQQSQQLIYHQQQMLMKQNSLRQLHIQQQQSLLQPTQMHSSQQSMMGMSSGLHPGQSNVPQTQPMAMQLATQSGTQQNQLNFVQESVQYVGRQQQQAQLSMHQQPSLHSQQPNIPLQQEQQQLMGQQTNLQQNQLIGQQNGALEMQQQQRLPFQSSNVQQTQQMLNQQHMPLHQPQQPGSQANMSSLQEVSSSTSVDSTAQTGHVGASDWQEEIYQMIKRLNDQYFAELGELFNKICLKLQHIDSSIPPRMPSEMYDRMKRFKIMLDRILELLQISKSRIQPSMRDKLPHYEKQIISILNLQRRPVQPQIQQ